jgi:hypothetical protein
MTNFSSEDFKGIPTWKILNAAVALGLDPYEPHTRREAIEFIIKAQHQWHIDETSNRPI